MLDDLKANNARWAAARTAADPDVFPRLARRQAPPYLWVGCSDSRVPANAIVGLDPGELFVHRNVANLASPQDPSWQAVLQFAVQALKVRHVLVVGHHGCGGVMAALGATAQGPIDRWIEPLRQTARRHRGELDALPDARARADRLSELNVIRQVAGVACDPIVRGAWAQGQALSVHGWVYALAHGLVRDLGVTVSSPDEAERLAATS